MSGMPQTETVNNVVHVEQLRESYQPNQSLDTSTIGGVAYRNVRVSQYTEGRLVNLFQLIVTVLREILQATVMLIAQRAINKIPLHNQVDKNRQRWVALFLLYFAGFLLFYSLSVIFLGSYRFR